MLSQEFLTGAAHSPFGIEQCRPYDVLKECEGNEMGYEGLERIIKDYMERIKGRVISHCPRTQAI